MASIIPPNRKWRLLKVHVSSAPGVVDSCCCHGAERIASGVFSTRNLHLGDGRFGSKMGQFGPKLDKSGAFSDQISVHMARGAGPDLLS